MRVLISGATGFIGRLLVLRLARDGHTLSALVRDVERSRARVGDDVALVRMADAEALARAIEEADAVVNLAGERISLGRWSAEQKERWLASRVGTTARLAAAVRAASKRPRTFVSASAVGYYGDRRDEILDERSGPGRDFLAHLCQRWEAEASALETEGVRVVLARLGVVLGAGGGALQTMLPPFAMGLGAIVGRGTQYVSWIHQNDVAEFFARALQDERFRGPFNVVAPQPVTNEELSRTLAKSLGRKVRLRAPERAVRAALGEGAAPVLGSQRAVPRKLEQLGFAFRYPNLELALTHLMRRANVEVGRVTPELRPSVQSEYVMRRRPRYVLRQSTLLDASAREVFAFFSSARNLGLLTPPSMALRIEDAPEGALSEGARLDYRMRLGPVPARWRTRIEAWRPQRFFADSQQRGPYRSWWHEHEFTDQNGRTRMDDRVFYAPPLGLLGAVANRLVVAPMLQQIFRYRQLAIELRFGPPSLQVAAGEPAGALGEGARDEPANPPR